MEKNDRPSGENHQFINKVNKKGKDIAVSTAPHIYRWLILGGVTAAAIFILTKGMEWQKNRQNSLKE